jgi:methylenetetrahydrofolate--tRNA-(uracil-5-)-methyltransferase
MSELSNTSAPGVVTVVGGGLAGCEAAWQLAQRGIRVVLVEQKPLARTPAQVTDNLAELVCSNSFRGAALGNAVGLLKEELRRGGSLIMQCADATKVPAGGALAVDRALFSEQITQMLDAHVLIGRRSEVVERLPEAPAIVATGPLTGASLAEDIARVVGAQHLAYYDAISPIVAADSIDESIVFRASRYDKGGDQAYLNCPFTQEQYEAFVTAVIEAEKVPARPFEEAKYFEGCLPVEVMAERGIDTLRYGPMKPVGLDDPRTGRWPYAVVQLRQEDAAATAYNIVGFQSRMTYGAQARVWRLIPGLQNAEFLRFGTVHRNTFVNAPKMLTRTLCLRDRPGVHLAGQITGVEGYLESAACGFLSSIFLAGALRGLTVEAPPATTALGGLLRHLWTERDDFQPSNITWAMIEQPTDISRKIPKRERYELYAQRALEHIDRWHETTMPDRFASH